LSGITSLTHTLLAQQYTDGHLFDTLQALVTLLHEVYNPEVRTAPNRPEVQQPESPSTQTQEVTQPSVESTPIDPAQVQPSTRQLPTHGSTTTETGQEGGKSVDGVSIQQACLSHAVPALLCSMRDYTTDNRGDVGSLCDPFQGPD
jgi:hypothetical protein